MKNLIFFMLLTFVSFSCIGQEKKSKKELREIRKIAKLKEHHLDLIEAAKDTTWGYFPYSITSSSKSGDDGGMFTLSDMRLTLFNIFIPNAKKVDKNGRIPSYDAKVLNYDYKVDDSENIEIVMIFEHEGTKYTFLLEKLMKEKWATLKLFANSKMLATYEGPLKK